MGLALCTAPSCGPWGFRHHGTSRRQSPTSSHAHAVGPGRAGADPTRSQPRHAPAQEPPAGRMAFAPPQSGPWPHHRLENPTAKALLARPGAQPSARRPPAARGGSVITGPRGASRPPARTHAVGPGTEKSGGGPYALATPRRSRSRAPTSRIASAGPQSGAHGLL